MPTSARKVRGQSGWFIRIIPPVLSVRSRDDVGIVPYAKRDLGHSTGHDLIRKGSPPHPEKAGPPSPSRRGHGAARTGLPENLRAFPFILAQSFGRAGSPSSVPGCARSTFPVGEGFLRRGLLYQILIYPPIRSNAPGAIRRRVLWTSYAKIGFSASASLSFWAWASARSLPRVVK